MNKLHPLILIAFILVGCGGRSAKNHSFTADVSSYKPNNCKCKLYAEAYYNRVGLTESYLTDSTNFRVYIGNFDDDNETINYHCKGDSVFAVKRHLNYSMGNTNDTANNNYTYTEIGKYSLKKLREKQNFK